MLVELKAELGNYIKRTDVRMDGFAGMEQRPVKKVEQAGEKEKLVFGKSLNPCNNSNAVTSFREKKDSDLRIERRIAIRIFYLVRFKNIYQTRFPKIKRNNSKYF